MPWTKGDADPPGPRNRRGQGAGITAGDDRSGQDYDAKDIRHRWGARNGQQYPMTAEMALRLGAAAGRYFRQDGSTRHRVLIGKDTRRSCYMLENALTAGLTSTGMNVLLTGPMPTPAVGYLTRTMRADLGIMISASHNPHHDNGIKFFGPDGFKLSDAAEAEIEAMLDGEMTLAQPENIGSAKRIDDGPRRGTRNSPR